MSTEELEIVKARYEIVCESGAFWVHQNNTARLAYDLRDFGMWLCDFIADRVREKIEMKLTKYQKARLQEFEWDVYTTDDGEQELCVDQH